MDILRERNYNLPKRKDFMFLSQKYKLDEEEALALEISQIWSKYCKKYFPNYQHTRLKAGDPRKSLIFKICYKLQRETKNLILKDEYELYVRAQLEILKYQSQNNPLVLVDSMCLVGEKAWTRWKLWKKKYDDKLKSPDSMPTPKIFSKLGSKKAIDGLIKTKKFIDKNLGQEPSLESYFKNKENLLSWINFGKISPYYLVISPFISEVFSKEELSKLNFDPLVYQDCIDEEVKKVFEKFFKHEHPTNRK